MSLALLAALVILGPPTESDGPYLEPRIDGVYRNLCFDVGEPAQEWTHSCHTFQGQTDCDLVAELTPAKVHYRLCGWFEKVPVSD